jgi:hypothetical protein
LAGEFSFRLGFVDLLTFRGLFANFDHYNFSSTKKFERSEERSKISIDAEASISMQVAR